MIALFFTSCFSKSDSETNKLNPETIVKDFSTWWNYNTQKINLTKEYVAFDTNSKAISRASFLKCLSSGKYIALRLLSNDSLLQWYKLYKLRSSVPKDVQYQSEQFGNKEYNKFIKEGLALPDFNFTDLNGTVYNNENTKGKIIVINCWFIQCVPCVAEIPALNEIVREYQNRNDVLFISLSFDSSSKLKAFLTKTKFNYAPIALQKYYVREQLKIYSFPTQIIVNKEGKIVRVFEDYKDIIYWLKKEIHL